MDIDVYNLTKEIAELKAKVAELELLLDGANQTCNKIAEIVGDHGQYRDLVEAVEMKIHGLKSKKYYE